MPSMAATAAAAAAAATAAGCLCAWGRVNAPAAERELTRPGPEIGTGTGAAALDAELAGWLAARMAEYDDDAAFRAKMEAKWGGRGDYEGYLREAIGWSNCRTAASPLRGLRPRRAEGVGHGGETGPRRRQRSRRRRRRRRSAALTSAAAAARSGRVRAPASAANAGSISAT